MLYQFNCKNCGSLLEAELARDALEVVCPICNSTFPADDLLTPDELALLPEHLGSEPGEEEPEYEEAPPSEQKQPAAEKGAPSLDILDSMEEKNTAAEDPAATDIIDVDQIPPEMAACVNEEDGVPSGEDSLSDVPGVSDVPEEVAASETSVEEAPESAGGEGPPFAVKDEAVEAVEEVAAQTGEELPEEKPGEEDGTGGGRSGQPKTRIYSQEELAVTAAGDGGTGEEEKLPISSFLDEPETMAEVVDHQEQILSGGGVDAPGEEAFGNYALISQVGVSDVAVTYRARHLPTGVVVALKVLLGNTPWAGEESVRIVSHLQEMPLTELDHPNLAKVFEIGDDEGVPFIATEFVEGRPFSSFLGAEISESEVLSIIEAVADGLYEAHKTGVVHGDIKPSNIIVDSYGNPLLVDFGFFRSPEMVKKAGIGDAVTARRSGYEFPYYAAPEQIDGDESYLESDVYSLGAVMYHFVTGRPPLTSDNLVRLCLKIRDEPPPPPRLLNPRVSSSLQAVILKCLAKRPQDRYHDCESLRSDIHRLMVGEPVAAEKKSRGGGVLKAVTRVAALLTLIAAGVGAYWYVGEAALRYVEQKPDVPRPILDAGAAAKRGDMGAAEKILSDSLPQLETLDGELRRKYLPGVYYFLGRAREKAGEVEPALVYYRKILDIASDHEPALEAAGRTYYVRGRYREAEEYFRRLLEVRPDDESRMSLALALWGQGQFEDARRMLQATEAPQAAEYLKQMDASIRN